MADTRISYVDKVWNPVTGCTKCSLGCEHCYAYSIAKRFWGGRKFSDVQCHPDRLEQPLHWKKPCRILVPSMGDLFHEKVPIGFLTHIFDTIGQCSWHTFMVLTKHPEQALKMMWDKHGKGWRYFGEGDYHKNIDFGVTVCNQKEADEKIPILLQIPAAHRWLSIEPILEDIYLPGPLLNHGFGFHQNQKPERMDQIVVGCESGPKRRLCKNEWISDIVRHGGMGGIKVFVKQMEVNGKVVHDLKDMPPWAVQEI